MDGSPSRERKEPQDAPYHLPTVAVSPPPVGGSGREPGESAAMRPSDRDAPRQPEECGVALRGRDDRIPLAAAEPTERADRDPDRLLTQRPLPGSDHPAVNHRRRARHPAAGVDPPEEP